VQQAYRSTHSGEEQVLAAIKVRMGRVALVAEIMPPLKNGKDRGTSARFSKRSDGWRTSISDAGPGRGGRGRPIS
jgi:hypothetical protein